MNRTPLLLTLAALVFQLVPAQPPPSPLVSAAWLQQHKNDPNLVLIHVAFNRRDFAREHIPGAQFAWWTHVVPSTPDLSSELPPPEQLDTLLESLGVSNSSTIVVYFTRNSVTSGTRILFTLQYYGLANRAFLLDGGLEAWKSAGGEVTAQESVPKRGRLDLTHDPKLLADADLIRSSITKGGKGGMTVVDARAKNFYDGGSTGNPRQGHIQGAVNIPFSTFVDSLNQFKPVDELRKMFHEAGIKDGDIIVPYCHVGQQATVAFQAARLCGYDVRLYDGSMDDWSYRNESYPMSIPEEKQE